MILQRIFAIRQTVPEEDAQFVALDNQMQLCTSTYVSYCSRLDVKDYLIQEQ